MDERQLKWVQLILGALAEADVIGEQQLKWMQSGAATKMDVIEEQLKWTQLGSSS